MTSKRTDLDTLPDENAYGLPGDIETYRTQTRQDLDTAMSWEGIMAASGLTETDLTFLGSTYRVIDKLELVNRAFAIRSVAFKTGTMGQYAVVHAIVKETNENVVFADGSAGVFAQLRRAVADRRAVNHPYPLEFYVVPNGLRLSEYDLNEDGHAALPGEIVKGQGRTFYIA